MDRLHVPRRILLATTTGLLLTAAAAAPSLAAGVPPPKNAFASVPLTIGWFDGLPAPYLSTDASDPDVAAAMGANYAPRLAVAANTDAVDDIYAVTNFVQGNVIPSRPRPAGPRNTDTDYTPLWQVTKVTWNSGTTPRLLTSERDILALAKAGKVTLDKTNVVVNCPVIYTPSGGLFPRAEISVNGRPQ